MHGGTSRREFLKTAAWAGGMGLPLLVAACTGGGILPTAPAATSGAPAAATPAAGTQTSGRVTYPTYVPFQGPQPDIAGTDVLLPAYFSFPKNQVQASTRSAGTGDVVNCFTQTVSAPPPPVDQNPTWQEVNKRLNVNLTMIISGNTQDAAARFATLVAGNDLPDTMNVTSLLSSVGELGGFLEAKCADLTPFLSGDAIKDFPNLANYPPHVWKSPTTVINGKFFTVPIARPRFGTGVYVHSEMMQQLGLSMPTSADDFKQFLQALQQPSTGTYAFSAVPNQSQLAAGTGYLFPQVFGAPNNWRLESSGKLTKDWETDEFKAGLSFAHDLFAAGLFHPNSLTYTNVASDADFAAGHIAVYAQVMAYSAFWPLSIQNSNSRIDIIPPFSADGRAKPQYYWGVGNLGNTAIKQAGSDRVREVLHVLDFFSAPFGTREYTLLNYGIEGTDFNYDTNGNPIPAANGFYKSPVPWRFIASAAPVDYSPVDSADYARRIHSAEQAMAAAGVEDPTLSLYSPTNLASGPARQTVNDTILDVVAGRSELSAFDQAVSDWRSNAGDKIRGEFEQALQNAK